MRWYAVADALCANMLECVMWPQKRSGHAAMPLNQFEPHQFFMREIAHDYKMLFIVQIR